MYTTVKLLKSALNQYFKGSTYYFKSISRTFQLKEIVKSSVIDRLWNNRENKIVQYTCGFKFIFPERVLLHFLDVFVDLIICGKF